MSSVVKLREHADISSEPSETILVVDDSRAQRRLLATYLSRWGYHIIEADCGEAALELCKSQSPDLIVSDWMMPGMTGLELCKAYRALRADRYGYFILLTSKSDKGEIAQGLDVGADDFLTKPFNPAELRARIRAGQRILGMERELTTKNELVSATLAEMQGLYDAIDNDLIEARKLQQSLVRDRFVQVEGADVSLMLQPAGRVGGDLVGVFPVSASEVGFYSLDVSGHGVASALLTARIAGQLTGNSPSQNVAIQDVKGRPKMRSPAEAVEALNRIIMTEIETEHYFTIFLARADLTNGKVTLCQAGHPHALVQKSNGTVNFVGDGGMPVGLIEGAGFDEFEIQLAAGDRLLLGSDGITECENIFGEMLEDAGLETFVQRAAQLQGPQFLTSVSDDLSEFNGEKEFADDVSAVLFEFHGAA